MKHEDNVVVRVDLPKERSWVPVADFVYFFPVTVFNDDDFHSASPMVTSQFDEMYFLPEIIQSILHDPICRGVKHDAMVVEVAE